LRSRDSTTPVTLGQLCTSLFQLSLTQGQLFLGLRCFVRSPLQFVAQVVEGFGLFLGLALRSALATPSERMAYYALIGIGAVGLVLRIVGILPKWSIAIAPLSYVETSLWGGLPVTLILATYGLAFAFPYGILLALGRRSNLPLIKGLCVGFIELIRGVPLISLLIMASVMLPLFLPSGTTIDKFLRAQVAVILFAGAYIAEVIRGGLQSLPKGQFEAADAMGLNYAQKTLLIILPQALKISIPGIVSSFIGLFKDTTLVAFVGLADPLQGIRKIVLADTDWKGIYWEPFIFVAAIFFVVCFSMSRYSMYLEQKLKTDHR